MGTRGRGEVCVRWSRRRGGRARVEREDVFNELNVPGGVQAVGGGVEAEVGTLRRGVAE